MRFVRGHTGEFWRNSGGLNLILIRGEAKSVGSTSALSRLNMKVAFAWILASSLVRPTLTTRSESFELHVCVYECRVENGDGREEGGG